MKIVIKTLLLSPTMFYGAKSVTCTGLPAGTRGVCASMHVANVRSVARQRSHIFPESIIRGVCQGSGKGVRRGASFCFGAVGKAPCMVRSCNSVHSKGINFFVLKRGGGGGSFICVGRPQCTTCFQICGVAASRPSVGL